MRFIPEKHVAYCQDQQFQKISSRLILASVGRSNSKYLDCPSHEGLCMSPKDVLNTSNVNL